MSIINQKDPNVPSLTIDPQPLFDANAPLPRYEQIERKPGFRSVWRNLVWKDALPYSVITSSSMLIMILMHRNWKGNYVQVIGHIERRKTIKY